MANRSFPDLVKLKKERFKAEKLLFILTISYSVIDPLYQDQLINLFGSKESLVLFTKYGHKKGLLWHLSVDQRESLIFLLKNPY